MKAQANQYNQRIIDARIQGKNAVAISMAEKNLLALRNEINAATATYNQIAGWIQTATGQNIGMAGLGVEPATIALVVAVAGGLIALGFALDKLSMSLAAAQGKSIETRGYLDQLGYVVESTGNTAVKIGSVVLVAGAAYLLYANRAAIGKFFGGLKSRLAR